MIKEIPNTLVMGLSTRNLANKQYLEDLDFIKENTKADYILLGPRSGVHSQNSQQCYGMYKEIVEHAHKIGLKICLHLVTHEGFYNSAFITDNHPAIDQVELFPIPDPKKAEALVNDIELIADENGCATYCHKPIWARSKIMPVYSKIIKAYCFEKTEEGFYLPESLTDVTEQVRITNARTNVTEFEIDLGKENSGKNVFVLLAQHYNYTAVASEWGKFKDLIDAYADIPFDGIALDEYGYMHLNTRLVVSGEEPPFRGRMYSEDMKKYYEEVLNIDLDRMLFDMRYAPQNDEKVRIKAINTYFEVLRHLPLDIEKRVYDYSKKVFGEDIYISCHNTFHNKLAGDEIWHTACNWWDIPRDFGHTDENIEFPTRLGIMLACKNPIMFDMFYSKDQNMHYKHIVEGAPFNCREIHHSFGDKYWGSDFSEPEFLRKINTLDEKVACLNEFQTEYPKMDFLIIYGAAAQNNWYPDYSARNVWDIDGTLEIQPKCRELWDMGYRCALVPDYAIEDSRITLEGNKVCFGGYEFSHVLFLYPKYAKKETYEFLNKADKNGVHIAVVGKSGVDFNGNEAELTALHFEEYSTDILEKIGCSKSAIENGCVYRDGSFSLVTDSLLTKEHCDFEFSLDGKKFSGNHTGLLAYRENEFAFATEGSELFINDKKVELRYI